DLDRMHRTSELVRSRAFGFENPSLWTASACRRCHRLADDASLWDDVDRLVAEGAPCPLVLTRRRVEHRHSPVAVPVGDEKLVGCLIDEYVRRLVDTRAIAVAAGLSR